MRDIVFSRYNVKGSGNSVGGRAAACSYSTTGDFLFANIALPVMASKAVAAMVRGPNDCSISCHGLGYGKKVEERYHVIFNRLPKFSTVQMLIIAKRPGLLLGERDEAVWRYLMSPEITTPLLPEWAPYISQQLLVKAKIGVPNGFGFPVFEAKFQTKDVDQIVSEGLRKKKIKI